MKKRMLRFLLFFIWFTCLSLTGFGQENPYTFTPMVSCPATEVKIQGNTGTCWSFSTSSFFESELMRKGMPALNLSEMFPVRKIYSRKAENYVRQHGKANFSQGALAHDFIWVLDQFGAIPDDAYPGKKDSKGMLNHSEMEKALLAFLDSLVKQPLIDPGWKITFENRLDVWMGVPPETFSYGDKTYDPKSFAKDILGYRPGEYIGFTSFLHQPFYRAFPVEVPDNFSRGTYFNLPLEELMEVMSNSLKKGYSVEWDGDVSENGFKPKWGVAVMPLDKMGVASVRVLEMKPSPELRQTAFDTYASTDDHLMHIVGLAKDQDGALYFKTKNSWGEKSGIGGYIYMSEAYLRMKTITIYVNKWAVPEGILGKLERGN